MAASQSYNVKWRFPAFRLLEGSDNELLKGSIAMVGTLCDCQCDHVTRLGCFGNKNSYKSNLNIWQVFGAVFEKCHLLSKNCFLLLLSKVYKNKATFYSNT